MYLAVVAAALVFTFVSTSHAEESCAGKLGSTEQVLKCAEQRSPEIQSRLLEVEQARAQVGAAGQWQNPEFSVESFNGDTGSGGESETDLAIGVPVELGGKLRARTASASGRVSEAQARLFAAQAAVRRTTLVKLHRLRQLAHEQEVIDESIATFSKLVGQYASRPTLSPEQQISAAVFRMSKSENELKRAETNDELAELNTYFLLTVGQSASELKSILPESPKSWPTADSLKSFSGSPELRLAEAELQTAQAEYSVAKSEAWPTLMVGPSMKLQKEGGRSDQLFGFNLSLPIPVFNANGAAKAAALAGVRLLEARRSFAQQEVERRREELARLYSQSVEVLKSTLTHQEIEKRHRDTERLFVRGIVPSSLVIEAHRTFVDLERSRNERELKALDALFAIRALTGEVSEIKP